MGKLVEADIGSANDFEGMVLRRMPGARLSRLPLSGGGNGWRFEVREGPALVSVLWSPSEGFGLRTGEGGNPASMFAQTAEAAVEALVVLVSARLQPAPHG